MITVKLPDGSAREMAPGSTALDLAAAIGPRLAKAATGASINGEVKSLPTPLNDGDTVAILTFDTRAGQDVFRHSCAHVMATAIMRLRPNTKLAIGPAIEDGFYYDMELEEPITEEDFAAIEAEMAKVVQEDQAFQRIEVTREDALNRFRALNDSYKVELIEDLPADAPITYYQNGDFTDLCRGPHLPSTGRIKAFKLLSVAGAYWRGDEKRQMLTRIYGTAFPSKKELDEYVAMRAEAEKRDHRKLGRQLDLFSFQPYGPGFPFFHPKGVIVWNELMLFWREEHVKRGYSEIRTPIILDRVLWEKSGHWDHYKENMYFTQIDERDFAVKPMNCPGSMLVFKTDLRSYRDLPLRMAEVGTVHRHEKSGVLHGLTRVRMFTQDDAHLFLTPEQIQNEVIGIIDFIGHVYTMFGFEYGVELSTRPAKSVGSDENWQIATDALRDALEAKGMPYKVNAGDGAFYGPKIDFHIRDSLKRSWQCATIQLDFSMPELFDLEYIGPDGNRHRPVVIHRVIYGSIERFLGILIEHFAGAFPLWLAPVQAVVVPVADAFDNYAKHVRDRLQQAGLRAEADLGPDTMKYKIRDAQTRQVPYMLVVGEREQASMSAAIRHRRKGDLGAQTLDALIARLKDEVATRALDN